MRYWAKIQKPNLTNAQLHFERSERGRPMLKSLLPKWDFNVSHAGKFTVFVAEGLLKSKISVFQFAFLQLHSDKKSQKSLLKSPTLQYYEQRLFLKISKIYLQITRTLKLIRL